MKDTPSAIRSREYRKRVKNGEIRPRGEPNPPVGLTVTGNTAIAQARVRRILTLDELIKLCKVDLKVWKVDRFEINNWEMGAKNIVKDMRYIKGSASGHVKQNGITIEPLHQVKAFLVRINPEPIVPFIRPANVIIHRQGKLTRVGFNPYDRWVIMPDPQVGFRKSLRTNILTPHHDRKAMDLAHQVAVAIGATGIVYVGDVLDLADWSDKFLREPNLQYTTQPSILESAWWMGRTRAALPDAQMVVIEGNHERRMHDSIVKDLPEAFGLRPADKMQDPPALSIPNLLGLKSLGIQWRGDYPDGNFQITRGLVVEHGNVAKAKSGATVSSMVDDVTMETRIIGHIHRIECAYKTTWTADGPAFAAVWSFGCLARIDGEVPGRSRRQNWQQGLGVIDVYDWGQFSITPVQIQDGLAYFDGRCFVGEDRTEDLKRATGWGY